MPEPGAAPEVRHLLPDRLFHWVMALSVIVLGATAFLPIFGIRFEWVPIHWSTGILLTLAILFHFYRITAIHGFGGMSPRVDDFREVIRDASGRSHSKLSSAKYDAWQKGIHAGFAITILAVLGTGLVMLAKIDTVFWRRNPSLMSDQAWGWIYVVHGVAAMILLFLFLIHVHFAFVPEHRAFLHAMISGKGPANSRKGKP